jgi:DNA-binding SARP family transcriptional activator
MTALARDRLRLILISRQSSPLKLQRSIVRRQAIVIDNQALAFTPQEISSYFKSLHGISLSEAETGRIHGITDGWAGGLVLLSQALQRQPRDRWHHFLVEHLPARLTDESMPYFSEEIFTELDPSLQDFLIRAALLEVVDPVLLSDTDEVGAMDMRMQQLVRQNLFVHVFHDERDRPLYRFNQLFHDFLRSIRPLHLSDRQRDAFLLKIADHYWRKGHISTAIDYFVRARNFDRAAAGIKKIGIDWMIRGRCSDLAAVITALPAPMVSKDPWLRLLLTLSRRIRGGARNIDDFQAALEAFQRTADVRGRMLSLAFLIEAHIFSGNDAAACRQRIDEAELLLTENSRTPYFAYAKALLWLQVGFGCIAGGLDPGRGLSACRKAWLLAKQIGDAALETNVAIVTALGHVTAGEFQRAEKVLGRIGPSPDSAVMTEYRLLKALVDVKLPLRRGNLDAAARRLDAIGREIESYGLLFLYPVYLDIRGFLEIYRADFAAAGKTCRQLLDVALFSGNRIYRGMAHRMSALNLYCQQKFADALPAVERAEAAFDVERSTRHLMYVRQLKGLVALRLGHFDQAAALFEKVLAYFKDSGNIQSTAETHLAYGLLTDCPNHQAPARNHLHRGLALKSEQQLSHFVHLTPGDLEQIEQLASLPEHGHPADRNVHTETAGSITTPSAPGIRSRGNRPTPDPLAPQNDAASDVLLIRTFGRFQVSLGGRPPIGPDQWGGRRPRLLLKSIVVHGLVDIPKDILIDDLWPESDPAAGNRNFKVTLHRLRKTLEPSLGKNRKSAYVALKDGRVSLNPARCRVDVQEFLHLCKDIKRLAIGEESDRMLDLGQRVMALYRGDFLPEEPYAPWAEMKRWALRESYLSVLMQMARIYERHAMPDEATACCQAAIAADPCVEEASQRLIKLYAAANRRAEAVKVYKQLCRSLQTELGVKPDQATSRLYHKLIHA